MRNEYEMKISKLIIDNDNKLNELKNDNFKQLECLNYELAKLRNDNVTLTRQFNEIQRESLLNEKRDKEEIQQLKNDLDYIKEENNKNIAKLENTEKNLINLQSENIIAMNSLNRQKEELKNNQNEILNLKNDLNLLKEKNEILEKKNKDLQNDYTQLCSHTENINFEYNKKLKNLSYIQDQKNQLEIENNTLRNNMNKYMRPYSFN
jgi:myosin heavy subunit